MKDFWQKEIKKNGKLAFLAPMDGYTDSAYRQVVKKINPNVYCVTEFYSADWIVYSKYLADSVLNHAKSENPLIVQIFGKNPENFVKAAKIIEKYDIAWIDVNMWCPARKVVKSGHWSWLLINEELAFQIISDLNNATRLPISVKTRLWMEDNENLINFVKWLEKAWASLVTVHWRTAKQAYTWTANLDPIYELKKHVKIPIICNWDIQNYADWLAKVHDLDWFMIGRASFGNPWCFATERDFISWKWKFIDWKYFPTLEEILEMMVFHAEKLTSTKWEKKWCLEIRKHLVLYLKNFPWVKAFRKKLVTVENLGDVKNVIDEIASRYSDYLNYTPQEILEEFRENW